MSEYDVTVVGAGLAGSEAAWQLAEMGLKVRLIEMKPEKKTPAHHSDLFGELVCSNSLRGDSLANAVGLLKEELRHLGSLILKCAEENRVEAGGALAVDRVRFAEAITAAVTGHENISIEHRELTALPPGPAIIATGPLTSEPLAEAIAAFFPETGSLSFYDAAAPLVSYESLDMDHCWFASRYDKGTPDYINCAMNETEYLDFVRELAAAEQASVHGFEDKKVFEGCMPVEVMARRGIDTLRFGPLKPVGLKDPKTGREPYAVVQLRKDNSQGTVYNIVGFQTHLRWPEQKRVFSMIPALKNAEYLRYGVMHRNTYIDSPRLLNADYTARKQPDIAFAGQMTGVEGYIESTASGMLAALEMGRKLRGEAPIAFPTWTAIGALAGYISDPSVVKFQPMNVNFGIIDQLNYKFKGKKHDRYLEVSRRSLETIDAIVQDLGKEQTV